MPSPPPGRREITLLQERSAGTFARVHLARATDSGGLSRIVAVKVLKERWTDTEDVLNRTRDEAQLLASLQHQNIVRVDAITQIDGLPAIIMEFVHGIDLSQLIKALAQRNMKLPHRAIYEIAEGIASALAAAWFKVPIGMSEPLRVVHRDIKPSNVMISVEGDLRVLDFGTARFESASRSAKTEAFRFGSLKYMSPERRDGSRGEHPADLYSLGLVIIELLGGRIDQPLPMDPAAHDAAVIRLIDSIPDFGLPNAGWNGSLRETLTRLCGTDPSTRLDARQTIKLMRAFKQQATGDGLIAFAEDCVAPITDEINAIPDLDTSAEEAGTRFALEPDGRTSVLRRSSDLSPSDGGGIPEDLPTQMSGGITDDLPTQLASPAISMPLPVDDDPTLADRLSTQDGDTLRPGFAMTGSDLKQTELPSSWNPGVMSRAVADGPKQTPGQPKRLPPPQPAAGRSERHYVGIGCAIASLVMLLLAGIGGVSWMLFLKDSTTASTRPTTERPAPALASDVYDTQVIDVEIHAGDPTVQWIRLTNAEGARILTARPDGTAAVPPGSYDLSVKVVARSVLSKTITIKEPTALTCKPTTMGRVRCNDTQGKTKLILRP